MKMGYAMAVKETNIFAVGSLFKVPLDGKMRKLKALVMVGGGRVNTSSRLWQQIVQSCRWSREPHPWFNFDTFSAHGFMTCEC